MEERAVLAAGAWGVLALVAPEVLSVIPCLQDVDIAINAPALDTTMVAPDMVMVSGVLGSVSQVLLPSLL